MRQMGESSAWTINALRMWILSADGQHHPMNESTQVNAVIGQLLTDEHQDFCSSIMAEYLEDQKLGADLIIAFGAKQ